MDLWGLRVKNPHRCPVLIRNSVLEKSGSWNWRKISSNGTVFEIRVSRRNVSGYRSLVVRAKGNKNPENPDSSSSFGNGNQSVPEGDGAKGKNSSSERKKSNDAASQKSNHNTLDWREFRAALFAREQSETAAIGSHKQDGAHLESKPLGLKWAHPISSPESGCVLIATEKLDGVRTFERTVVLLLSSGTGHPQDSYGIIINRPLNKRIKHMKPTNHDLATTFGDCSLHFGGPLDASMFLLKTGGKSQIPGLEEVAPGLCFGSRNCLDEAARLVKKGVLTPQDFNFYFGYAGWDPDQLREEIEWDYWHVAACSANLIFEGSTKSPSSSSSDGLWDEILQLMGGHYSERSRKPKQDM